MVELIAAGSRDPAAVYATFLPALSKEYAFWMEGSRHARARQGAPPRRAPERRHAAQPLLGRPRQPARGSVPGGRGRRRAPPTGRRRRSIAICARAPKPAGTSARAGSPTARPSRPFAPPRCSPSTLTACCSTWKRRSPRPTRFLTTPRKPLNSAPVPRRRKAAMHALSLGPRATASTPTISGKRACRAGRVTAATLYPLFFGLATKSHADRVAKVVQAHLLKPGGLVTTTIESGEQWDAPNGWAPLQWIAIQGPDRLRRERSCPHHRVALDEQCRRRLSPHRQADGEIQRGRSFASRPAAANTPARTASAGPMVFCARCWCSTAAPQSEFAAQGQAAE